MRRILLATRRLQRWHRRWPHWAKDLYGLISYVNFVELIPTLSAIALAPRHFFRRLPQILAGKSRIYQTPIKFFVNFASLFLLLFFLRNGELREALSQTNVLLYALLLIPLTPLVMPALGACAWALYQAPRLLPGDTTFPQPNSHPFAMVLSPLTYFRLSPGRFIWGLFYMSIYFVAAWQFAQVAIGVNLLATVAMFTQMGEGHFAAKAIVILMSLVALAASIHLLVFRPYGELFRWALRRPTLHALLHDLYPLRESADAFLECVDGVDGANGRDTNGVEFAETEIDAFPYLLDAFCDELDKKLWQVRGLIRSEYQRQFLPRDWELLDRSLAASLVSVPKVAFLQNSRRRSTRWHAEDSFFALRPPVWDVMSHAREGGRIE